MDNQHRKIIGYRELTPDEINLMNLVKSTAEEVGDLVERVRLLAQASSPIDDEPLRWAHIAKTDLQTGFMALIRSIARPTTF